MKHKINPTVDCVFKAILGSEENKNLLIHFLNAVLEPDSKIKEIVLNNPLHINSSYKILKPMSR